MTKELVKSFIDKAIEKVLKLPIYTKFQVSQLFDKTEWNALKQPLKMQIGARFYDRIKADGLIDVIIQECNNRKRATVYQKIS